MSEEVVIEDNSLTLWKKCVADTEHKIKNLHEMIEVEEVFLQAAEMKLDQIQDKLGIEE